MKLGLQTLQGLGMRSKKQGASLSPTFRQFSSFYGLSDIKNSYCYRTLRKITFIPYWHQLFLPHGIQTNSGANPTSFLIFTRSSFHGCEADDTSI